MNDTKNIFIAWISSGPPMLAFFATDSGLAVLSAVILPIVFFAIGKTIDVLVQVYLKKCDDKKTEEREA
jgi:hypothetical protein